MKTLDIVFDSDKVTVRPVPRSLLPVLEKLMIELQSIWIEEEFSTGDAITRDDCWALIRRVWVMLPIAETPKATLSAESLESISHDYEQLERLFFGGSRSAYDGKLSEFDLTQFEGCAIWALHKVDARKKLIAADALRRENRQAEPSPPEISQSPAVETPPLTPSLTSSTASEKPASPYSNNSMPTPSTG